MLAATGTALFAASGLLQRSLKWAFGRIGRKRRGRRSIEVLRTLDDRLLADIGVDRCSIGFAACHGRLPRTSMPRSQQRLALVHVTKSPRQSEQMAAVPVGRQRRS